MTNREAAQQLLMERRRNGGGRVAARRSVELAILLGVFAIIAVGLGLVYFAKTSQFEEIQGDLKSKQIVNLNAMTAASDLLPHLGEVPRAEERQFIAERVFKAVKEEPLPRVGSLAYLRVPPLSPRPVGRRQL